jgi:hypothetical protein
MKKLILISALLILYSNIYAKEIRDWETNSTLFCGLQKEQKTTYPSEAELNAWYFEVKPTPDACGVTASGQMLVGLCIYWSEPKKEVKNINKLSQPNGWRNFEEYTAFKIQFSEITEKVRILGFKSIKDIYAGASWELVPKANPYMSDAHYEWEEEESFNHVNYYSITRDDLVLRVRRKHGLRQHRFSGGQEVSDKKFKCTTYEEKLLDEALERFKQKQSDFNKKLREEQLMQKDEQKRKNKI